MGERLALVIGSQCDGLPGQPLSFLPARAEELFAALTDPERGACTSQASRLLVNPSLPQMVGAVRDAVRDAAAGRATLVLAFVGHAEVVEFRHGGARLYLLPKNGRVPPDTDSGYQLGERMLDVLAGLPDIRDVDGLVFLLDACHAGLGVAQLAQDVTVVIADAGIRLQLLAATFDRKARDGCLSESLVRLLSEGLPELSSDYLDVEVAANVAASRCRQQEPPVVQTLARGRRNALDPGLFLGRNPAAAGRWALAGTGAGGHAVELTRDFQVRDALEAVQGEMARSRVTVLVGDAGSGKSAVVAALARPEVTGGLIPAGFVHAVAFTSLTRTATAIATELAGQLRGLDGFVAASERYQAAVGDPQKLGTVPALRRLVVEPLRLLPMPAGRRVRLVIDGIDQLAPEVVEEVAQAPTDIAADPGLGEVRILLTTQPRGLSGLAGVAGLARVDLGSPTPRDKAAYLRARGTPDALVSALLGHATSWLDLRLLADLVAQGDLRVPLAELRSLDELYRVTLEALTSEHRNAGAVLAVLAAAGTGPVLPITVASRACGRLGGPTETPGLRDVLVGIGGLAARADAGTDAERVGLFHDTLTAYLRTRLRLAVRDAHQAILDVLGELTQESAAVDYRQARAAEHLWALGRHSDAVDAVLAMLGPRAADNAQLLRPWSQQAAATLDADDPDSRRLRSSLAHWTGESGDVTGAVAAFTELLAEQARVLGPDDTKTLTTRRNLAGWTGRTGDVTGAVAALTDLLTDVERTLGPDDPNTLTVRNNLGYWRGDSGDVAGAVAVFTELLATQKRVLGPDHPDTLRSRYNLADWTGESGDVTRAVTELTDLLTDVEHALGPDHPDTLLTRSNLAYWTGESGDVAGAVDAHADLLVDMKRILGPNHPVTLRARSNLARLIGESRDVAVAAAAFTELLATHKRVLGPDHPDTLRVRFNLADLIGRSGDVAGAVAAFTDLLADQERVLGLDHPHTQATRGRLAYWTGSPGT
jgi:hypothetical protein